MLNSLICSGRKCLSNALREQKAFTSISQREFAIGTVSTPPCARQSRRSNKKHYCQSSRLSTQRVSESLFQNAARRAYVTSTKSLPPTSFPDPDRPDLFYHLFEPPTSISNEVPVFALSFLPEMPSAVDSCAVIGWLPAAAASEADQAGLNDFKENGTSSVLTIQNMNPVLSRGLQINSLEYFMRLFTARCEMASMIYRITEPSRPNKAGCIYMVGSLTIPMVMSLLHPDASLCVF